MKDLLDANNLIACSTHVPLSRFESELGKVIAFNQAISNDCLVLPALPQDERPVDAAGWLEMGRRLDVIGQRLRRRRRCASSITTTHGRWLRLDGKLAIDWLFEGATPENLLWEPDIAWIVRGGVDPVEILGRYTGRCPRIHVKDLAHRKGRTKTKWALPM